MTSLPVFALLAASIVFFLIAWRAPVVDPADPNLRLSWQSFIGKYGVSAFSPKGTAYGASFILLALSCWTALFRAQDTQAAAALASRISLFPGAALESATGLPPRRERLWTFRTSDTPQSVISFYAQAAPKDGWQVVSASPTALILSKPLESLAIIIVEKQGGRQTVYNIIYRWSRQEP